MSNQTYAQYINSISDDFGDYFNIISTAVGVPLNLVAICIFWRLRKNKTNMGVLGILQATVDILVLMLFMLIFRSSQFFGRNFASSSNSACKFLTFLRRFILHASSWVPVLTTFDRFTYVLYGHGQRFKFMSNKLILAGIVLVMFTLISIADVPNLLFYVTRGCSASQHIVIASDIVSICLRTYIPFILMVIFNWLMIRKLFKNKRITFKQNRVSRNEYQFTFAVMAYDIYFIVFNFPLSVFYILNDINSYSGAFRGDRLFSAIYGLANSATVNFAFFVQILAFFMYFGFNKMFRSEFLHVVGSIFHISRLKRVAPSNINQTHTQTNNNNTTNN